MQLKKQRQFQYFKICFSSRTDPSIFTSVSTRVALLSNFSSTFLAQGLISRNMVMNIMRVRLCHI